MQLLQFLRAPTIKILSHQKTINWLNRTHPLPTQDQQVQRYQKWSRKQNSKKITKKTTRQLRTLRPITPILPRITQTRNRPEIQSSRISTFEKSVNLGTRLLNSLLLPPNLYRQLQPPQTLRHQQTSWNDKRHTTNLIPSPHPRTTDPVSQQLLSRMAQSTPYLPSPPPRQDTKSNETAAATNSKTIHTTISRANSHPKN